METEMKLRITIAALVLTGTASLFAAPTVAQTDSDNAPPSGTAWQPPSDQPQVQEAPSDVGDTVTIQWGGSTGGAREPIPMAPRGDNTAYSPTADQAADK
jgi:hypothetical protein